MADYEYDPAPKGRGKVFLPYRDDSLVAAMKAYLAGRRLDYGVATWNGWYPSSRAGDSLPRIVIPGTITPRGPFWQARHLGDGEPRYQSPGGERNGAVIVVRPYRAPRVCVITEGPMDALVAAMHGHMGIAVMGNTPGQTTCETISGIVTAGRLAGRPELLFMPDLDSPGSFAAMVGVFSAHGFRCRLVLPSSKDLASCSDVERAALLR